MRRLSWMVLMGVLVTGLTGCLRPAEERARLDGLVGQAEGEGLSISVVDGLAQVQTLEAGALTLWAQAPRLEAEISLTAAAPSEWRVTLRNGLPDLELTASGPGGEVEPTAVEQPHPTIQTWTLPLAPGETWTLRWQAPEPPGGEGFRYAVLSDVQDAMDEVQEVFDVINAQPDLAFVVSSGDLVEEGTGSQLREFQARMEGYRGAEGLHIPLYATPGNHEPAVKARTWFNIFGRGSFHWRYGGACFTFADSSAATIDPDIYDLLKRWLGGACRDGAHVVLTHVPPIDPEGGRGGGWRSRKEAAKFFTMLGRGRVDAAFYGHVHSFYAYSNGTTPAYISGGGGAIPERQDGIGRHFLVVETTEEAVRSVGVVRVD